MLGPCARTGLVTRRSWQGKLDAAGRCVSRRDSMPWSVRFGDVFLTNRKPIRGKKRRALKPGGTHLKCLGTGIEPQQGSRTLVTPQSSRRYVFANDPRLFSGHETPTVLMNKTGDSARAEKGARAFVNVAVGKTPDAAPGRWQPYCRAASQRLL